MKYDNIYTCDRCGKKYNLKPTDVWNKQTCFKCSPLGAMVESVNKYGFVDTYVRDALADVESVIVTAGYNYNVDRYDLCPECAKELKKFLRNEQ